MGSELTAKLAAFATSDISQADQARDVAILSALDWLAVGLAGQSEPVARILKAQAEEEAGIPQAHLFGGGAAPARMAALVNGTISHALDYDDTHFAHIGHPSVAVFPAALAIAERQDAPVQIMLDAALVGMELSVRLGQWLGRSHYEVGFHQTATAGAFGATAAAGRLLGFDTHQMAMALGLCATRAAGLKAQFGTMGKPYNAGLAASAGVEVALLVARGLDANADALEGARGFYATHHGTGDVQDALQDLGQVWRFADVSHKFHACCHGLHAALEAGRALEISTLDVRKIDVRTHPRWMSVCNQTAPETGLGAKFSYKTVMAMQVLGYDTARLDSYSTDMLADPRIGELQDTVSVIPDADLSETEAVLNVSVHDAPDRDLRLDLLSPMTFDQRKKRVRQKAESLIGAERANAAWDVLQTAGTASAFAGLMA